MLFKSKSPLLTWGKILMAGSLAFTVSCQKDSEIRDEQNSLDAILATNVGTLEGAYVDILGYFDVVNEGRNYILGIDKNVHVVKDCASPADVFALIDQDVNSDLKERSLKSLTDGEYSQRATLSCVSETKPKDAGGKDLEDTMYYDEGSFYVGTGVENEYYKVNEVNSDCVFDFVADLFSFDYRFGSLQYSAIPNGTEATVYELSCKDRDQSVYGISTSTPTFSVQGIGTIIYLEYYGKNETGTTLNTKIPFYRIDGETIVFGSPKFKTLIDQLRETYSVSGDIPKIRFDFKTFGNKALFDYCIDSCSESRIAENGAFTSQGLKDLGTVLGSEIPTLSGRQSINWKTDSQGAYQFFGCEGELLDKIGIKSTADGWFSSLRQQVFGQFKVEGDEFVCPSQALAKVCERPLDQVAYSDSDFNSIISERGDCSSDASILKIRVDSDITITGRNPVRFGSSSPFKEVILEPFVPTDRKSITFEYNCTTASQCTSTKDFSTFSVSASKILTVKNIDYLGAANRSALGENDIVRVNLQAFTVSGAAKLILKGTSIINFEGEDSLAWSGGVKAVGKTAVPACPFGCAPTGAVEPSDVVLIDSTITADRVAVAVTDSRVVSTGQSTAGTKLQGSSQAINFSGKSEGVITGSNVTGGTIVSIGRESKAITKGSKLRVISNTLADSVEAFKMFSQSKPTETPFALEMIESELHGLPASQVSNFTFADFSRANEDAKINMINMKFFRDQVDQPEIELSRFSLPFFLSCEGQGQLLYRFKNYCE